MTDESLGSFETLYRTNYRKVRGLVLSFRIPAGAADDVIQDTFVTAWEQAATLKNPKAFSSWLMMIARNRCLQELRGNKKFVALAVEGADCDDGSTAEITLVADDTMASFHWENSVALIQELIESHDSEPRGTVARMFYLERLSVKEIVAKLNLKQNTVLSHLSRFRQIISDAAVTLFEERGIEIG